MPYLKESLKREIDYNGDGEQITSYLSSLDQENFVGAVNYLNFKIARRRFGNESKWKRYFHFAGWVGTMLLCILEVWRRMICIYEEEKIKENGDVE